MNLSHRTNSLSSLKDFGRVNLAADECYGSLLTPEVIETATQQINKSLEQNAVKFETKSLTLNPLPVLLSSSLVHRMDEQFAQLHRIVERIPDLYCKSSAVREFFRLPQVVDEFVRMQTHVLPQVFYCRFDFSIDLQNRPRVYELNAASPAGIAFSPHFYNAIDSLAIFKDVVHDLGISVNTFPNQRGGLLMQAIADSISSSSSQPHCIGIINSKWNTMVNELDVMESEAKNAGICTVRAYLEDLVFANGRLWAGAVALDAVYAKIDVSPGADFEIPITKYRDDAKGVLDAIASGIPYINPFCSSSLIENKSTLALLHSNLVDAILSAEDRALIAEIIPPTMALHLIESQDLHSIESYPHSWVLKKSLDTRGRSVVIGACCSLDEWRRALEAAQQDARENYIIQAFDPPESCSVGGCPQYLSHASFVLQGRPCGLFSRTARKLITNVGSGGAVQVPLIADV